MSFWDTTSFSKQEWLGEVHLFLVQNLIFNSHYSFANIYLLNDMKFNEQLSKNILDYNHYYNS